MGGSLKGWSTISMEVTGHESFLGWRDYSSKALSGERSCVAHGRQSRLAGDPGAWSPTSGEEGRSQRALNGCVDFILQALGDRGKEMGNTIQTVFKKDQSDCLKVKDKPKYDYKRKCPELVIQWGKRARWWYCKCYDKWEPLLHHTIGAIGSGGDYGKLVLHLSGAVNTQLTLTIVMQRYGPRVIS